MHRVDDDSDWLIDDIIERGPRPTRPITAGDRWRSWWRAQARRCQGDALRELAARQGFVITTAQAHAHGMTAVDIRRALRRRTWWAPAYGVLSPVIVDRDDDHVAERRRHVLATAGVVLSRPEHLAGARSAAITHGLPTLAVPPRPEVVTRATDTTGNRRQVLVRGGRVAVQHITTWYGMPIVVPSRAVVDVARFDRLDGVMAADAALRDELCGPADLAEAVASVRGFPGVRRAAEVLPHASGKAESPFESITRLVMIEDGFPVPELQVAITTRGVTYRVDMLFREQRLIVEIDGLSKYTAEELRREKLREARLRALGYRIERVTWEDVMRYWPQTRARLWAALVG
ncbi:MAG: DUF559 domain-containing protein [Jatrophihabitans sp.]|uniref:DUF559 domain-containing protein n=1 Tax=Jatrophihabitans sp. TaxID=1932789 RepID=UPI003F7EDDB9